MFSPCEPQNAPVVMASMTSRNYDIVSHEWSMKWRMGFIYTGHAVAIDVPVVGESI
jgi:hypothetical protein